jgi:hypothetical protein
MTPPSHMILHSHQPQILPKNRTSRKQHKHALYPYLTNSTAPPPPHPTFPPHPKPHITTINPLTQAHSILHTMAQKRPRNHIHNSAPTNPYHQVPPTATSYKTPIHPKPEVKTTPAGKQVMNSASFCVIEIANGDKCIRTSMKIPPTANISQVMSNTNTNPQPPTPVRKT